MANHDDNNEHKYENFFTVFPHLSEFSRAVELKAAKRARLAAYIRFFRVFAPASMASAVVALAAALTITDLFNMEEKMPNNNRTVLWGPDKSPEYLPKYTRAGVFEVCFTRRKCN